MPFNRSVARAEVHQPEVALWLAVVNQAIQDVADAAVIVYRLRRKDLPLRIRKEITKDLMSLDVWSACDLLDGSEYITLDGLASTALMYWALDRDRFGHAEMISRIMECVQRPRSGKPLGLSDADWPKIQAIVECRQYPDRRAFARSTRRGYIASQKKGFAQLYDPKYTCDNPAEKEATLKKRIAEIQGGKR